MSIFYFSLIDVFIISRPEVELTEIHQILMENLYHVSAALASVEINHSTAGNISTGGGSAIASDNVSVPSGDRSSTGGGSSTSTIKDTVDIITTL